MTTSHPRPEKPTRAVRWLEAILPASGGGWHPLLLAARSKTSTLLLTAVSLALGAVAGFLLVLIATALPGLPSLLVGFAGGAFVGVGAALALVSRFPVVRKVGALALLLAPILVLLAPFLWIGALVAVLARTRPGRALEPGTAEIRAPARRARRVASRPARRRRDGGTGKTSR